MHRCKVLFLLLPLLTFFLPGCAKKEKIGITTLSFIDLGITDEIKRMNPLIKRFEKSHPGVKIKVEYNPSANVREKILIRTTGDVPLDIVYLNDTAFPEFVAKGVFQPLDDFIVKDKTFDLNDFYPQAIKCATFDGKIYSIPPTYGTYLIYYNKKLFQEAGVPYPKDGWTWEDFRESCKRLTIDKNKDGKPDQFGSLGMGLWFWLPMIFQNGGRILDENGRCVFNSKEVVETLQFVKDLYLKDKVFPSALSPSGMKLGGMNENDLFSTGKIAMLHADLLVLQILPKTMDWDIVSPPEKKGGKKYFHGGFWGYAITSNSKNKELAWEFLKFLTSQAVISEWTQGTKEKKWGSIGAPSRKSLKDAFLSVLPDKHLQSYFYCLQYPEFSLAQPWGSAVINEVFAKYNIAENLAGVTKEDLKVLLDEFTKAVNENLKK